MKRIVFHNIPCPCSSSKHNNSSTKSSNSILRVGTTLKTQQFQKLLSTETCRMRSAFNDTIWAVPAVRALAPPRVSLWILHIDGAHHWNETPFTFMFELCNPPARKIDSGLKTVFRWQQQT